MWFLIVLAATIPPCELDRISVGWTSPPPEGEKDMEGENITYTLELSPSPSPFSARIVPDEDGSPPELFL